VKSSSVSSDSVELLSKFPDVLEAAAFEAIKFGCVVLKDENRGQHRSSIIFIYLFDSDHKDPYGQKEKNIRVIRNRRATCKPHITTSQTRFGVMQSFECSKGQPSLPPQRNGANMLC